MTCDLKRQVFDQISYYFSDANLRKDKFLKEKIASDPDGWVDVSVLLTFNRLKSMTDEASIVADAISDYNKEDASLIELSEDKSKVRRTKAFEELSEEQLQELNERTVHFKGFPQDASLDEIKKFCAQFGSVESVEMRRFREDRKFKGCILVIYSSKDEARKAVDSSEVYSADLKFQRETKVDYLKRKAEYLAQRNARKSGKKSDQPSESSTGDDDHDPVKVKSCVLLVSNVPSDLSFAVIKETMKHHGSVQYVDIDSEKKTATVRFSKENEAISVLKTASKTSGKDSSDSPDSSTTNSNTTTTTTIATTTGTGDEKSNAPPSVKIEETEKTTDSLNGGQEGSEKENGQLPRGGDANSATVKSQADDGNAKVDAVDGDGNVKEGDIIINEKTYHAVVLTGEAEVDYWRALNEFRRNSIGNVNRNNHRSKKGRGFKRGGGGYKGNREGTKRTGDESLCNSAKKAKTE